MSNIKKVTKLPQCGAAISVIWNGKPRICECIKGKNPDKPHVHRYADNASLFIEWDDAAMDQHVEPPAIAPK